MDHTRRRFERAAVSLNAWGETKNDPDVAHLFNARTRDIAARGTCLVLEQPNGFSAGQRINFGIEIVHGDLPVEAHGLVRWVRMEGQSQETQLMGVEMLGMRTVHDYERWLEMLTFFGI